MCIKVSTYQIMKTNKAKRKRELSPDAKRKLDEIRKPFRKKQLIEKINRSAPPRVPAPMSLANYSPQNMRLPCIVQPKLDGCFMRIANIHGWIQVLTSGNKTRKWLSFQVCEDWVPLGYMIEGEFYGYHDTNNHTAPPVTFQCITSAFLRERDPNLEWTLAKTLDPPKFVMYAFDIIPLDPKVEIMPYFERYNQLKELIASQKQPGAIQLMPSTKYNTEHEVDEAFNKLVKDGCEGAVIKNPFGAYESGWRSNQAMKRKPFHDEEFKLVDLSMASNCLRAACINPKNNIVFGAAWHVSHEEQNRILNTKSKIIGKMVTVQYNLKSDNGIPRAGIVKGIRLDETESVSESDTSEHEE